MNPDLEPDAPVVVGALGGSGTRVLGDILMGAGVHLGGNLNTANDSVTATVLFNRPGWAADATPAEIDDALRRLRRFLLQRDLDASDYRALFAAAIRHGHTEGTRRRLRYARRVRREHGPQGARSWGWKEPNSHLFVPDLARTFPGLRFIYLARHPLDMAFSSNLNQLRNWAGRFGVELAADAGPDDLARGQLDLWIHATKATVTAANSLLGERFLQLRFDHLVDEPRVCVDRIVDLIGAPCDDLARARLAELPVRPESVGRHHSEDLSIFRADQIVAIEELWGEL